MTAIVHELVNIRAREKRRRPLLCPYKIKREKAEEPAEHNPRQNLVRWYRDRFS